jgi:predicted glycosyltransferase
MKILVAPLHWGLGHATRCVPVIRRLLLEGNEVVLASDGAALSLLQEEFPALPSVALPAYNIRYPTNSILWNMLLQSRQFFKAIRAEYADIQQIVAEYQIDQIISDNRFGCYSPLAKKNIFLTHQLNLITPFGLFDAVARCLNHRFVKRFDELWIPDYADEPSLSGKLSHGYLEGLPPVKYIGALSRFEKKETVLPVFFKENKGEKKILVVLSGPEPQRTFLEEKIISQAQFSKHQFLIIRGLVSDKVIFLQEKNITSYTYMTSENLNQAMLEAEVVVSRSGYTSIMDFAKLGKKALLIPTPGQTEQEYLAKHFLAKNIIASQSQKNIQLDKGIEDALKAVGF